MSAGLVALRFAVGPDPARWRIYEWWWPRGDRLARRIRALSSATLVRALRVGVIDADHNPVELMELLAAELRRRMTDGEWIPTLKAEEVARWLSVPVAAS